ncbi:MAG: tetratricopeptide repeat protein [Rhodospirillales bacterium]|nr:tetratricopeptide repeat protein [Rhodospirillales bacterium]
MRQGRSAPVPSRQPQTTAAREAATLVNHGITAHQAGRLAEAEGFYIRALALDPVNADALNLAGVAAWTDGRYDDAQARLEKAISIRGNDGGIYDHLGLVCRAQNRLPEAEAAFRQAVALEPSLASAHNNLALLLANTGRLAEALPHLRHAIAANPANPVMRMNLGEILSQLGHPAEAAEAFLEAIRLRPNYGEAYVGLATLWRNTGNIEGSITAINAYLRIDLTDKHGGRAMLALLNPAAPLPDSYSPEYIRNLFDGYAGRFDEHLTAKLGYQGPAALRAAVDRIAGGRTGPFDVLDLGCGTGLSGVAFKDMAGRLVGVDLSPRMIDIARKRGIYDRLIAGDILAALLESVSAWDIVIAADVFVYVGRLETIFPAVAAALRPRGLVAFSVEDSDGADVDLGPGQRYRHGRGYIARLAAANGLTVASCEDGVVREEAGVPVKSAFFVLGRPD